MAGEALHTKKVIKKRSPGFLATLWRTLQKPQWWFGCLVLCPILLWYLIFGFAPIARAFWMAVVEYKLLAPADSPFVGLKHFRDLAQYDLFWLSLQHTIFYSLALFAAMLPVAFIISLCLTTLQRGRGFFQFVIYLPVVLSMVAISLLFKLLMDPQVGPFNQLLRAVGLPGSRFLSGPESALLSVIGVDLWKTFGFYVILLTAGLLNIPQEVYDAAEVDGVNRWQSFRYVTLPLLGHTLALTCVLIAMHGLQVFTQVVVMPASPGGPGRATYVLNLLVYNEAFTNFRFGFATAAAFVLFLLTFIVTLIQLRLIRPTWSY